MEIKVRNIPQKFGQIAETKEAVVVFYRNLASLILGSCHYEEVGRIVPITFSPTIENVGDRFLVLGSGKMVAEEPIFISLISENGKPFGNDIKRGNMVTDLTLEIKKRFGQEIEVEIELINEAGIFVYCDGKALN